jgi:hypothetical protein
MHNPTLIPALLRDTSVNNGLVYRELRKALPCRIGIEFEMGKLFLDGFKKKYDEKATDKSMAEHYGVFEIRSDTPEPFNPRRRVIRSNTPGADDQVVYDGSADAVDDRIIETRVSIKDYHQLVGLYRFMQDLPEFCLMHEGGGIHIHIDMSMYKLSEKKAKEVVSYIRNRLDVVGKLFPTYKGKYNRREVGYHQKSTWVNVSAKNTLEFRTPPLTFDYYTLMKWITGVVKFRNILIHECKLVLSSNTTDKIVKEVLGELQRLSTPDGENYTIYTDDGSTSSIQLSSGHTWVANNYATSDPWTSG